MLALPLVLNLFSGQETTQTVSDNLLHYYDKGEASFFDYVKCAILHNPGAKMPSRSRLNLEFFGKKTTTVHKQRKEIGDQKLQIQCLRKQLAMSRHSKTPVTELQQFVALPRALCKADGMPYKPPKFVISGLYEKQYPESFSSAFPSVEHPMGYFIDGMVLISKPPISPQKTFRDYIERLFRRWVIVPFVKHRADEVHMVFDHPNRHGTSPKDVERAMRDSRILQGETQTDQTSVELDSQLPCKTLWTKFLANRPQKRKLVNLVCSYFLTLALKHLAPDQVFIVSGGFDGECSDKVYEVSEGHIHENPIYNANHEEGDTRVWLHISLSSCKLAVIYSIDRDVMHVGMPLAYSLTSKQIFVQLRAKVADDLYCNVSNLVYSFERDLSLRRIGSELYPLLPRFMQVLFVCSGCDFVSGFMSHPKREFLAVFRRDCFFITGDRSRGLLSDTDENSMEQGLLAFYRLIGCIYFRAHASAFPHETPEEMFNSYSSDTSTLLETHLAFLSEIRTGHFHRVATEENWMPTPEALRFHWLRACFTIRVWCQTAVNYIVVPDLFKHGWQLVDGKLQVTWDTPENIKRVNDQVRMLKSRCGCKKSGCKLGSNCGCRKAGKECNINCKCQNCQNVHSASADPVVEVEIEVVEEEEEREIDVDGESIAEREEVDSDSPSSVEDDESDSDNEADEFEKACDNHVVREDEFSEED